MRPRRAKRNWISAIEASYTPAPTEAAWLTAIADALEPDLGSDRGLLAYVYDARTVPVRVGTAVGDWEELKPVLKPIVALADKAYVEHMWRTLAYGAASEGPGFDDMPTVREYFYPLGVRDIVALNAFDPSGRGVWVGAPRPAKVKVTADERRTWSRVAAHVASAFRLRMRARPRRAAVLSPSGRVEHAEGDAKLNAARAALHDAVLAIDRARGSLRHRDPEGALGLWRGLVDGRWTLVDEYHRGGKRYVVAMENAPVAPGPEALTARERQVMTLAAAGYTNKLCAYELGLSDSTIRVLLSRAMKKLDVGSRAELIALAKAHAFAKSSGK